MWSQGDQSQPFSDKDVQAVVVKRFENMGIVNLIHLV